MGLGFAALRPALPGTSSPLEFSTPSPVVPCSWTTRYEGFAATLLPARRARTARVNPWSAFAPGLDPDGEIGERTGDYSSIERRQQNRLADQKSDIEQNQLWILLVTFHVPRRHRSSAPSPVVPVLKRGRVRHQQHRWVCRLFQAESLAIVRAPAPVLSILFAPVRAILHLVDSERSTFPFRNKCFQEVCSPHRRG